MNQKDRDTYIERYGERFKEFGCSPQTLGWGSSGRQEIRFRVLTEPVLPVLKSSVLDVGCGFADLFDYLIGHGWKGRYCGIDIIPNLLDIAREKHPDLELLEADISETDPGIVGKFDFVIASGVYNAKLQAENNLPHIENGITRMFRLATVAVCADFLSAFVDFQHPVAWHTHPSWAAALARKLTSRFVIRHDYMPFEFAMILYVNDSHSPRNVFTATEAVGLISG